MEIKDRLNGILQDAVLEMRGDGKAGSGMQLAIQSVAAAAVEDPTLFVQEWPFFSSARKGAPTRGFLRLSRKPILKSSEITHPHIVLLMDEGVTHFVDFAEGVGEEGIFVANTKLSPDEVARRYHLTGTVVTIDGDGISSKHLSKPLGNISVFAILMELLPGFDPESARERLRYILKKRNLPSVLVEKNITIYNESLGQGKMALCREAKAGEHQTKAFDGYGDLVPGAQSRLRLSRTNHTAAYARTGYVLHFEDPTHQCTGCGHCIMNCPENIIRFVPDPKKGLQVTGADISSYCKLCRECIEICPKDLFSEVPKLEVLS